MEIIRDMQKRKAGRDLAKIYLSSFSERTERILNSCGIGEHVAILTFGSAGDHFLLSNSDTDFTLLDDGSVSKEALSELQILLFDELRNDPWNVSFKSWERVKVNPMDLLSIRFICGNKKLFVDRVINDPFVSGVNCEDTFISTLAGNDLHLRYMASYYFSRLLRMYHTTKEMPVEISYGDVKYYFGGTRCVQDIYMIAMLYSEKRFLADTKPDILVENDILSDNDLHALYCAVDFLLAAKDLCIEGNNILYEKNSNRIMAVWGKSISEITNEYEYHTDKIQELSKKAHKALMRDFKLHKGVAARTLTCSDEISALIDSDMLELWRIIALRSDITNEIRAKLESKILNRQKENPHTMLDELLSMMQFSSDEIPAESKLDAMKSEDETNLWMTDQVAGHYENILKNNINQQDLIRLAVHSSFFNLYKSGKYPDLQSFYQAYFDRVKSFFHCHTAEPDVAVEVAKRACEQIISSGLFNSKRLTLLELHLTNRCNLNCSWCTYKTKDAKQSIIFEDLTRIRDFSPIEILIAGGGEPTLFQNNERNFNDVIACLRENLPGARLRLITNGTVIPKGDWLSKVDEISISFDDVCPESYLLHKGQDLFHIVWQNIQTYLFESPVSTIRVTKIYNRQNASESIILAENLFLLWSKLKPKSIKACYFRFMLFPMADDQNQCDPYASSKLTAAQKENWLDTVSEIRKAKPDFYSFLENNTNLVNLAETEQEVPAAEKCWPVTHYMLIGADRKIYPCFAMCSNFCMTSIGDISLTLDELLQRRENLFSYPPLQCRSGCRPGSVFYGQRSKEYYLDKGCLKLPTIQYKKNERPYIIHVSYHDPDHLMGGQGWAVYNLCREQTKRGELVYWFSPCVKQEIPGEYLYENGQLRVIKIKFTDEAVDTLFADDEKAQNLREKFGRSVVEKIKIFFNPADCIIHLHGFIELPRLSSELRKEGYRVISTFHMLLSKRNEQLQNDKGVIDYLRKLEKSAIDSNSVISAPSNGMTEELMEVSPDFKGSIYCVHNGVGEEHFTTPFPEEKPLQLVVSYGRISPEKGYDLFIDAAKLVIKNTNAQEQSLLRFLIFGNTDYTIETRRLYAENLMKSIQGNQNIQALISSQGIIGPEKIALIDQAMFGVILSRYEPFGMVIPELMARGKPVITTLTPGSIDIMQSDRIGRNDFGFIVEPDAASIAEAIEWMICHPSDLKIMGKHAIERASQFRWKNTADEYYHLYRQL